MVGGDLRHHLVDHVDQAVRLVGLQQVVAGVPLAELSLEPVEGQSDVGGHLQAPDVLDRVQDARALQHQLVGKETYHGQLHLGQADLLDGVVEVLAHVVLRVVENDDLHRSTILVTYRLLVLHVPPDPPQELDDLRLLRALDDLVVERPGVRVHRTEDADAGAAPRQPAEDLLALLLPQIPRPVQGVRRRLVEVEDRCLRPEAADQPPDPPLALLVQLHRRRLVRDVVLQLRLPDVVLLVDVAHRPPRDRQRLCVLISRPPVLEARRDAVEAEGRMPLQILLIDLLGLVGVHKSDTYQPVDMLGLELLLSTDVCPGILHELALVLLVSPQHIVDSRLWYVEEIRNLHSGERFSRLRPVELVLPEPTEAVDHDLISRLPGQDPPLTRLRHPTGLPLRLHFTGGKIPIVDLDNVRKIEFAY